MCVWLLLLFLLLQLLLLLLLVVLIPETGIVCMKMQLYIIYDPVGLTVAQHCGPVKEHKCEKGLNQRCLIASLCRWITPPVAMMMMQLLLLLWRMMAEEEKSWHHSPCSWFGCSLRFQCPTLSEYHYLFNFITVQHIPIYPEPAQTIDSKGWAIATAATKDKECELLPP